MTVAPWKQILRDNFTSLEKLCAFLNLQPDQQRSLLQNKHFPLNLPRRLAEKIEKSTLNDPLLKQFVSSHAETEKHPLFVKDPVGDCQARLLPKYLQKYDGRVLLLATQACAMHCRYCFRQKFDYAPLQTGFAEELNRIEQDKNLKEIILSGGDPLSLSNEILAELLHSLGKIAHLKRLRFHTRFPIGIPERIDAGFLALLKECPLQTWFVIHCNHPRELDSDVLAALKKIQQLAIPVLNQAVLLKGVNDSIETLQTLSEALVDHGIMPYYLHQLDRVEGTAHFEVDPAEGRRLIAELNTKIAGYGVPKYVHEIASAASKTPL